MSTSILVKFKGIKCPRISSVVTVHRAMITNLIHRYNNYFPMVPPRIIAVVIQDLDGFDGFDFNGQAINSDEILHIKECIDFNKDSKQYSF